MKYTEFTDWCNERACDGCWGGINIVTLFLKIIDEINSTPIDGFHLCYRKYKKAAEEKAWQKINTEQHIEELVKLIDCEINNYKGVVSIK